MADFPTALDEALSDHYSVRGDFKSPVDSRRGFQARVRALEKAHGSKRAAAAAAGISKDTWSRWATGKQMPGTASLGKVAAAHLGLLRAAKVARKGYPSRFEIKATVACLSALPGKRKKSHRYNGKTADSSYAYRLFRADQMTGPQIRDVVNAWAAGQKPATVADLLRDRLSDAYGSRFDFEGNDVIVTIIN